MGVGETIYSDAASLGRLRALVGMVAGAVISIFLIYFGFQKLNTKNPHTKEVQATVTQLTGCSTTNPKNPTYECTIALQYVLNGVTYNVPSFPFSNNTMPYVNQVITVYYDPANPSSISAESADGERLTGKIMIFSSLIVMGIAYFIWWLTKRYQFFAAAQGVGTAGSIMKQMWE